MQLVVQSCLNYKNCYYILSHLKYLTVPSPLEESLTNKWLSSLLISVPKKGDHSSYDNYRGIPPMFVTAKLYKNRLLLERLKSGLDSLLRPNLSGFRSLRSTTQMILSVLRLIETDSTRYNVPFLLTTAIILLHKFSSTRDCTTGGLYDTTALPSGVLQGYTHATYLFVIVMDYILCTAITDGKLGYKKSSSSANSTPVTIPMSPAVTRSCSTSSSTSTDYSSKNTSAYASQIPWGSSSHDQENTIRTIAVKKKRAY